MGKLIYFPTHRPIIREYTGSFDITEWLGKKSINIVIRKNSLWQEAIDCIYIYQRGGPVSNYFDRREKAEGYIEFRQKLSNEEERIVYKWLKKIQDEASYRQTLTYLKKRAQK